MFGLVRATLALMVVVYHFRWSRVLGPYAVFGFYVISGYLMTLVMQQTYGYDANGRRRFLANRALRLLPAYWFASALSVVLLCLPGGDAIPRQLHYAMTIPHDARSALENASMMFPAWVPLELAPRLVPDAWTLTVEVFFYLAICLGLSRTPRRCMAWLAVSIAYVLISFAAGASWWARYLPLPAASLPFCVGALIYHAARDPALVARIASLPISATGWLFALLANGFFWGRATLHGVPEGIHELGLYLNLAIVAMLTMSIAAGGRPLRVPVALDRLLGELSYPIYLLQWQAAAIATWLLTGSPRQMSGFAALRAWPVIAIVAIAMAIVVVLAIDRPVQRMRIRLRPTSAPMLAGSPA